MCGIAGYWNPGAGETVDDLRARAELMAQAILHRGPDSGGVLVDPAAGLALAHRRLSIRDLSSCGHQPMTTDDGRFSLTYNGEIYHTDVLAQKLRAAGVELKGTSDTEILLYACQQFGVAATLAQVSGMFAFALFDHRERKLWLARDRFGIKPLYWSAVEGRVIFASELGSFYALPDWRGDISPGAVAEYLCCGYITAPHSIWREVEKLEPGMWLEVDSEGATSLHQYWNALTEAEAGAAQLFSSADENAVLDELDRLLSEAVTARMVSDVPLGAFLSGGIDSSLIVAYMQKFSAQPVRSFSISFSESTHNEGPYAKAVAEYLGCIHTDERLDYSRAIELLPEMPAIYGEPFGDSSQLPTFLLCEVARRQLTVALSGDGGDELFGGYGRYMGFLHVRRESFSGKPLRHALIRLLGSTFSRETIDRVAALLPARVRPRDAGRRITEKARELAYEPWQYYSRHYLSYWDRRPPMKDSGDMPHAVDGMDLGRLSLLGQVMLADIKTYLPGDILTKVDRASMANSLEVRPPMLDERLYRFAWRLPDDMRVRDGANKYALRQILYRYVPRELVDRPKMGFGVPVADWLRGPLRDWAEELLGPSLLGPGGWLDAEQVRQIWERHKAGENWEYWLWVVLMFQAWLRWMASPHEVIAEKLPCRVIDGDA